KTTRGISARFAGNCKSRTTLAKVSRLLRFPAGFPKKLSGNPKSWTEIQKVGWKLRFPSDFSEKLPDFSKSRLTFSNSGQLFEKSDGNPKCGLTLRISGRKS